MFHLDLGEKGGARNEFLVLAGLLAALRVGRPGHHALHEKRPAGAAGGHPLFGLLSTMVVESRMAFFSDALGHSAFTGMAIGALCGLAEPVGAAVVFAVVIALLFTLIRQKTHMASDTAISVFSSAAVALGIFLSTLGGRASPSSTTCSSATSSAWPRGRSACWPSSSWGVVILWVTSFNPMMLSSVHQALADSRGIRVVWKNFLFTAAIAVVVTITMTWVGLFGDQRPAGPPGAAARNVARNLPQYHLVSVVGGWVCGIGGCWCPTTWAPPPAPPSPSLLAVWFFVSLLFRKSR